MLDIKKLLVKMLNKLITVDKTSSITYATSGVTFASTDNYLFKYGNVCELSLRFAPSSANSSTSASLQLATLPSDCLPAYRTGNGVIGLAFSIWGANPDTTDVYIATDGKVYVYGGWANKSYIINLTYIAKN